MTKVTSLSAQNLEKMTALSVKQAQRKGIQDMEFVHVELKRDTWSAPEIYVKNLEDAVSSVRALVENLDRELVVCVHTATSGRVINASVCSMGTMTNALVSPAEVLRTAILSGAHGLVMIHNHPSGSCQPSKEDLQLAKELATVCELMRLQLLDFIIIGACGATHSVRGMEEEWLQPCFDWRSAFLAADVRRK